MARKIRFLINIRFQNLLNYLKNFNSCNLQMLFFKIKKQQVVKKVAVKIMKFIRSYA